MSTLEDKILDGPTAHYCDAEDDDLRSGEDAGYDRDDPEAQNIRNNISSLFSRPNEETEGLVTASRLPTTSTNTGPKGVIEDYRKQSSTDYGHNSNHSDNLEAEFEQLMKDDSVIKLFADKRVAERVSTCLPTFGQVIRLETDTQLLNAVDDEKPEVLVIVHIYTRLSRSCSRVNQCLDVLAERLNTIKFVTLDASVTGLSENFKENGVPALLVYKGGSLVNSLLQLEELLDRDFDADQLQELLVDNGIL